MGLFNVFSKFFKPKSEYEKLLGMVGPMLVKAYREIAKERGIAPTSKISDKKIVEIYVHVESRFKDAAKKRNEELPQGYINNIVLYFYQVYEGFGSGDVAQSLFYNQIDYEIKKYLKEGLRKSLRVDLQLFDIE